MIQFTALKLFFYPDILSSLNESRLMENLKKNQKRERLLCVSSQGLLATPQIAHAGLQTWSQMSF